MPEPGWVRDPSGRYHQRYFDGIAWTEHVADDWGRRAVDPVEAVQQSHHGDQTSQTYQPPFGQQPALPAVAGQSSPTLRRQPVAAEPGVTTWAAVTLAGSIVAVAAICFLPWLADLRTAQLGGFPTQGTSVGDTVKASWFESGWAVTLIALVAACGAALSTHRRTAWIGAVPIVACTAWTALSTIWIRLDDGPSLSYGFFVGATGLVLSSVGVLMATAGQRATPSR
jgi:hypothetical protein